MQLPSGDSVMLLDEHIIGRSSRCDTQLDDVDVSSRHALVIWRSQGWWVRDLGSTNGTRLGSAAIAPGEEKRWHAGHELSLGGSSLRLVDDSPPCPGALQLSSGQFFAGEPSLCLIEQPGSAGEPPTTLASIYLEHGTQWWLERQDLEQRDLERPGEVVPIADGELFQCAGQTYRFFSGGERRRTEQLQSEQQSLRALHLEFTVSLDEEHVSLVGRLGEATLDLGSRTHHYTLLTLARCRQRDQADPDLPPSSHGWISSADLAVQLGASETKLSVEICRIRQQLSKLGLSDAADIIERRRGSGQLRIGIADFSISRA